MNCLISTEDYIFRYSSNRISYLCYQFQTCIGPKCFNRVLNVVYCRIKFHFFEVECAELELIIYANQ